MQALSERIPETEENTDNPAARMWGLGGRHYDEGGRHYDEVSFAISDALAHAAQRLAPKPGDRVLDVATGTGWTARNCARLGADVVGVDFSRELLDAAIALSEGIEPPIRFRYADAEQLPFADGTFDAVISTFGVMFAPDQRAAAGELVRVCRPGGRIVLATWPPGGTVETFFGIAGPYSDAPLPPASPFNWGSPEGVRTLLGNDCKLDFEAGVNSAYHESLDHIWEWYARGFGPVKAIADALDPERREAFRRDVDAYHAHFLTDAGRLHVRRDYLIAIGWRR